MAATGANTIQSDLKIFCGRKAEIAVLEQRGQITANKWYLAWDTGEIFVATPARKLIQYGGKYQDSSKSLTDEDVKELISTYTKEDLTLLKKQITTVESNYKTFNEKYNSLKAEVTKTLNRLENNTETYLKEKILENMSTMGDLYYTKKETDNLIRDAVATVKANVSVDKEYLDQRLAQYTSNIELDNKTASMVRYVTGDDFASKLAIGNVGVYIVSKASLLYPCGIYYVLAKDKYVKIASGGGETTTTSGNDPEITITFNGKDSAIVPIGSNFMNSDTDGCVTLSYSIKNLNNVQYVGQKQYLTLYNYNGYIIKNPDGTEIEAHQNGKFSAAELAITNTDSDVYQYRMTVSTAWGTAVNGYFTVYSVPLLLYGCSDKNELTNAEILALTKSEPMKSYIGESVDVHVKNNNYLYLAIPASTKVKSFWFNGFRAPFEHTQVAEVAFGTRNVIYYVYRSSSLLVEGDYEITLK